MKSVLRDLVLPDYGNAMRHYAKTARCEALARRAAPRPWVARRTPNGMEFVDGLTEYSNANQDGTKGITVRFFVECDVVYEVNEPLPMGGGRRYRMVIHEDGTRTELAPEARR